MNARIRKKKAKKLIIDSEMKELFRTGIRDILSGYHKPVIHELTKSWETQVDDHLDRCKFKFKF